jgi:bis(5'-nucleosyl)-tetraphosphatase (symmetrical)
MRQDLLVVLGNHDLHLLAIAAGVRNASRSDTFDEILAAPDREELLDWLAQQALIHHEQGHTLVHAGIPPQWTVQQAVGYAGEVEVALRGLERREFLGAMYGNEPSKWSDDLTGMTRLRVITNYLTRMRYCTRDGSLDLESKGASPIHEVTSQGEKVSPWFSHAGRKSAGDRILFGHWATLAGHANTPGVIALDTGCVWNGALSLYHLESEQWTRCACHKGECRDQPGGLQS